jgi:isoleucyl-tRNA synthetase
VFDQVSENVNFVKLEETVLQHWTDIDAFQTSLKMSEGRPIYTFYDGPPFATGLPHYGHILAGTIKVRCASRVVEKFSPVGGCACLHVRVYDCARWVRAAVSPSTFVFCRHIPLC